MKWYWVLAMLLYASITFFFYTACIVAARYDDAVEKDRQKIMLRNNEK